METLEHKQKLRSPSVVDCLCQVAPASGVPGDCYLLGKGEQVKQEEEEEEEETDDGGEIQI